MKKRILIISGGISKERTISLDTGKQVAKELSENGYVVKITEPNFKLLQIISGFRVRKAFSYINFATAIAKFKHVLIKHKAYPALQ